MTSLLTVDEAAVRLAIHPQSVRELIWAEKLGYTNVGTGKRPRYRVPDSEIERFIAEQTRPPRAGTRKTVSRATTRASRQAA